MKYIHKWVGLVETPNGFVKISEGEDFNTKNAQFEAKYILMLMATSWDEQTINKFSSYSSKNKTQTIKYTLKPVNSKRLGLVAKRQEQVIDKPFDEVMSGLNFKK